MQNFVALKKGPANHRLSGLCQFAANVVGATSWNVRLQVFRTITFPWRLFDYSENRCSMH